MKRSAFTLIELLVVIAIIALLLSILIPALAYVKEQASSIVCLSNGGMMGKSWCLYSGDNDGLLVCGDVGTGVENQWAAYPQDIDGGYENDTFEGKLNGIMAGALYPYNENTEVYHCPGDKRYRNEAVQSPGDLGAYRSYSVAGSMNGQDWGDNSKIWVHKEGEINTPSARLTFIEESEGWGWNARSWDIYINSAVWVDPVAIWHNERSILVFADSHAEKHHWLDERTLVMAENQEKFVSMPGNKDHEYLQKIYQPRGH